MQPREITYLGFRLKELHPATHGRSGWRIARTGQNFATLRDAKNAVATRVFPYPHVGGPPIGRRAT